MKRILVTGSNGIIGRILVARLLDQGNLVYGCDFNPTIVDCEDRYKHYMCDAKKLPLLDLDEIYHLVGDPCPSKYLINPTECISNVINSTYSMMNMATTNQAKIFIASSSEVYADSNELMIEEDTGNIDLLNPRSCYKESKRMVEVIATGYKNQFNTDIRIGRIFNTYGESNDNDTRAIPAFIHAIKNDKPIILYGSGSQVRSFCYVEDTVEGMLTLMNSDVTTAVNIGNPKEAYTINAVLEILTKIMNKDFTIINSDEQDMIGPIYRRPDTTIINRLGWKAIYSLEEGLRKIIGV